MDFLTRNYLASLSKKMLIKEDANLTGHIFFLLTYEI